MLRQDYHMVIIRVPAFLGGEDQGWVLTLRIASELFKVLAERILRPEPLASRIFHVLQGQCETLVRMLLYVEQVALGHRSNHDRREVRPQRSYPIRKAHLDLPVSIAVRTPVAQDKLMLLTWDPFQV